MDRVQQLRVFVRIAACSSFAVAADQLGLPRASVTIAMQQLETRLGVRLLHRTTRSVALTQDGEAFLQRAAALVDEVDELEQLFRPGQHGVAGRLRVDVPSRIARRIVAPALPGLLAQHPHLQIDLGSSDRVIDLVHEGVDCALRVGALVSSSLIARPLGHFELINCASPAYLHQHSSPQSAQDLAQHFAIDYVSPSSGRAAPWEWIERGELRSTALRSRVSANNAETYIALALAGMGLIQIPAFDVQDHLQAGELVRVLQQANPAPMPVHLLYPHRKHLSRRLQVFLAWIEALIGPQLIRQ